MLTDGTNSRKNSELLKATFEGKYDILLTIILPSASFLSTGMVYSLANLSMI